jgi:hypothetical protein
LAFGCLGVRVPGEAAAGLPATDHLTSRLDFSTRSRDVETHGPLGTLWVGMGLIAFYLALIWLNTLLGIFLTPLFLIPGTWLQDYMAKRKQEKAQKG